MSVYSDQTKNYTSEIARLNKKNLIAIGYEQLIVDGGVDSLQSIPAEATYMELSLESNISATIPVRYLMLGDTTLPTTTTGLPLRDGTFFDVSGRPNLINFRVIEATNGVHTLNVQYYK